MKALRSVFPNAWVIAVREYRGRTRSRSFVLSTLLLAFLAFAAAQGPVLLSYVMTTAATKLTVYSEVSNLPQDTMSVLDLALNGQAAATGGVSPYKLSRVDDLAAAERSLKAGGTGGLLVITRDPATADLKFELRADVSTDSRLAVTVSNAAGTLAVEDRLTRSGVSTAKVFAPPAFSVVSSKSTGEQPEPATNATDDASKYLMSTGFIILIFMAIITYGTWVAMSVAEEKGSRVMELMLNAATPLQMLTGKVIGIGTAGLTQYGIVVGAAVVGLVAQGPVRSALGMSGGAPFAGLTPWLFVAFLCLFLLGFLLYALLYAALGSLVSRQEDVQSATGPLMMLIFVGYFASIFGLSAIDEPWVVGLSYVPFFSPYLMLARIALGHVAIWEIALVVALMLAASAVALFFAARIYSAGVLLYGQRVSIRKVLSAARVAR